MRLHILVLVVGLFAVAACGGGDDGGDAGAFCDAIEQMAELIENTPTDPAEIEDQLAEITALASEAAEAAPEEIADTFSSTDAGEQEAVTDFIAEECGVEFPGL